MTPNSETRPLRHSGVGWFAESHTAGDRGAKSSPRGLCEAAMGRARAALPGTVISGLLAQARAAELARRTLGSDGGAVLAPPSSRPESGGLTGAEEAGAQRGGGRGQDGEVWS